MCMKTNETIKGMMEDLREDGVKVEELNELDIIGLWLEAAQVYHKNLRGVKFNEQTTTGKISQRANA